MDRRLEIERIAREHGLLAVYLFGSRADDGLRFLVEGEVEKKESDLDVGVVFRRFPPEVESSMQLAEDLGELFDPFRVDYVRLQNTDSIFQFRALSGHRIAAPDSTAADNYELDTMRMAAELLPIQRARELEALGFTTT
ncbi:MAG TPA: nucleotidyltransferase domain-containing protein [Thermoanaerobaculia bacterium]|nr:nucleotidyltransferase domain-containing protein [Thermoanaerobaculia bacterium]